MVVHKAVEVALVVVDLWEDTAATEVADPTAAAMEVAVQEVLVEEVTGVTDKVALEVASGEEVAVVQVASAVSDHQMISAEVEASVTAMEG